MFGAFLFFRLNSKFPAKDERASFIRLWRGRTSSKF